MFLAIDAGNTNIVFAIFEGGKIIAQWRCETHGEIYVKPGFLKTIQAACVSSVVPDIDDKIINFCQENWNINPVFINAQNAGIEIIMDTPSEVGADRLVNAVAVAHDHKVPAIILDFGTATTFDVIDEKGRYQGGVIAPGINLSLKALQDTAAKLPEIEIRKPPGVIGKNTVDAMRAGIYHGYLGLIEAVITEIKKEVGSTPFVLATGGLASLFAGGTEMIDTVDADLTLRGLHVIYKRMTYER